MTDVGASMIDQNKTVADPESAAYGFFDNGTFLFTSSGGFSNIYPIPDYQQAAVSSYFENYDPGYPYYELTGGFDASKVGNGIYNRIGHGIPDVSANGKYLPVIIPFTSIIAMPCPTGGSPCLCSACAMPVSFTPLRKLPKRPSRCCLP